MTLNQSICISFFILIGITTSSLANDKYTLYKNERGSLLYLTQTTPNNIVGYFKTAVASEKCPKAVNQKRPIVGVYAGNAISIAVSYPKCGSVITFSGNFYNHKKSIETTSILVHQAKNPNTDGPGARYITQDRFHIIK